jgi:hypothetical protein
MMEYKSKYIQDGMVSVHPIIHEILKEMDSWCQKYDKSNLMISESLTTLAQDNALKRVSSSHREGRACDIDVSPHGVLWPKQKLIAFSHFFGEKYKSLGANSKLGTRTFLLVHDSGHGLHCHAQIGKDIVEKFKNTYPNWKYPVEKNKRKKDE